MLLFAITDKARVLLAMDSGDKGQENQGYKSEKKYENLRMRALSIHWSRFTEQTQTCDLIDVHRVGYLQDSDDQPVIRLSNHFVTFALFNHFVSLCHHPV